MTSALDRDVTPFDPAEPFDPADPVTRPQRARLHGAHVSLRPILHADYEPMMLAELSDALGPRWRHRGRTPSPDEFVRSMWTGVLAQFLVIDHASGMPVGVTSIYNADFNDGFAYFALAKFDPARPSRRLLEGAALFLDYAFANWPFRKLYAESIEENFEQFHSAVRWLFREEGRLRGHVFLEGHYTDTLVLALYRETWEKVSPRFLHMIRAERTAEARR
jgi:RimJ/RimL family protein N-acetyltransferase